MDAYTRFEMTDKSTKTVLRLAPKCNIIPNVFTHLDPIVSLISPMCNVSLRDAVVVVVGRRCVCEN